MSRLARGYKHAASFVTVDEAGVSQNELFERAVAALKQEIED